MGATRVPEHKEEKADFFSIAGTTREGVMSLLGAALYIAEAIDMIGDLKPVVLRYSAYGFGFGCVLAIALAAGSAYCHNAVNVNNQNKSPETETTPAEQDIETTVPQSTEYEYEPIPTEEPINNADVEISLSTKKSEQLSLKQKAAVAADFCSDAMGTAGGLATAVNLATGDSLSKPIKFALMGVTLFAGMIGSVAEARMCAKNLQLRNSKTN